MDDGKGWSTRFALSLLAAITVSCVVLFAAFWWLHVKPWGATVAACGKRCADVYAHAGAFGDAFAPVVGLLSTLTLAAAVVSVFMQRAELAAQRRESEASRIVQERQLNEQQNALEQQERDHWLARDEYMATLLRLRLDLFNIRRSSAPSGLTGTQQQQEAEELKQLLKDFTDAANTLFKRMRMEGIRLLAAHVRGDRKQLLGGSGRKRYRVHNVDRMGPRSTMGDQGWDRDGYAESFDDFFEAASFAKDARGPDGNDHVVVIQDDGLLLWDSDHDANAAAA